MADTENHVDIESTAIDPGEGVDLDETVEVDVEQIMRQIRAQIESMPREPLPDFSQVRDAPAVQAPSQTSVDANSRQLANEIEYLKANYEQPFYWDMGSGPKGLFKRAFRRLNRFLLFPILQRQSAFNLHATNGIEVLRNAQDILQTRQEALGEGVEGNARALEENARALEENARALQAIRMEQDDLRAQLQALRQSAQESQAQLEAQRSRLDGMDRAVDDISMSVARVIRSYMSFGGDERPSQAEAPVDAAQAQERSGDAPGGGNAYETLDYFRFQNDFRGTQNQIMERQRVYLPYFRGKAGRVFDLGCGRGEFLRLMKQENIPAFGVDTYPEYEVAGKLYGIDIETGDGIEMLERMDEPLGGIFCAQVIEHLGFKTVEKLCRLAWQKLERGAYLVLESPNPMCVSTMTNGFYIDPTHDKPVHPLLMEYMLKSIGFSEVKLLWPDHSLPQLPPIRSESIENLDEVNRAIELVSGLLFGSQDYAVVARR